MSMLSRSAARSFAVAAFSVAATAAATSFASAQAAPAAAPAVNATALKVGDVAPDFTVAAVTAAGLDAKPFKLSEHRGETIVLAFFPKARTSGCTMQMHAYRDKYKEMFKAGRGKGVSRTTRWVCAAKVLATDKGMVAIRSESATTKGAAR